MRQFSLEELGLETATDEGCFSSSRRVLKNAGRKVVSRAFFFAASDPLRLFIMSPSAFSASDMGSFFPANRDIL